jgi:hypothetical protein
MTRKTQTPASSDPTTTTPAPAASAAFDVFRKPRDDRRTALTHEKIADDLAAFQRVGGKIEVLGTTYTLKSLQPTVVPAQAQSEEHPPSPAAIPAE